MNKSSHKGNTPGTILVIAISFINLSVGVLPTTVNAQDNNPNPPEDVVKLIFIHHSTGENWLADGYGGLGITLSQNNYYVSDTNYGWGPDAIGDRTDIIHWLEWFRGPESARYMDALFNESGQNSSYTRTLSDPGGENEIIMFKSCFPNSEIEGNPDDPPAPDDYLTVSNAKYIYNDLLEYFITRPDKLFVVITAPPVQNPTYAANARAFNTWLVYDWLAENNYPYTNVVVFDFYNVLTHQDNHHRLLDGEIEHSENGRNTLFYPSDDDHPNQTGSRKATSEFVPLLNIYYHLWKMESPAHSSIQVTPEAPPASETQPPISQVIPMETDEIDNFEGGAPPDSDGWQSFWDEGTQTVITCGPELGPAQSGNTSLHINFNVQADSWATCTLLFLTLHDWQASQGISFYVHTNQPATVFDVNAYGGAIGSLTTYLHAVETTQEMVDGWVPLEITWDLLLRADWEENAGTPFDPSQVRGIAIGFSTYPDTPSIGEIWVDDLRLMDVSAPIIEATTPPTDVSEPEEEIHPTSTTETEPEGKGGGVCPGSIALGCLAIGLSIYVKRRN